MTSHTVPAREAMKIAIEALEIIDDAYNLRMYHQKLLNAALTALRQAAEHTQQGADGVGEVPRG